MDNPINNVNTIDSLVNDSVEERTLELTETQKRAVMDLYNKTPLDKPPTLKALVAAAWGEKEDTRTWRGKLVREFLVSQNKKYTLVRPEVKKGTCVLTDEQKEFIENNCKKMNSLELARELFNNKSISPLHIETRTVNEYINSLNPKVVEKEENEQEIYNNDDYVPPKTLVQSVARTNRYIFTSLDFNKLTSRQKKGLNSMIGYLNTKRFQSAINRYTNPDDRILFESEFVRCTYDKDDLTEEEVDQYIIYATEVLIGNSILNRIQILEDEQDNQLNGDQERINMALVEAVKSLRDEYNKCVKRQNDILNSLKGTRRERLDLAVKDTASVLHLVHLWKEEESRRQIINLAIKEQQAVKEEFNRLNSLEEVKAKILGISEDEALYG